MNANLLAWLWFTGLTVSGFFLVFAAWFRYFSSVLTLWEWRNNLRITQAIEGGVLLSTICVVVLLNGHFAWAPWWAGFICSLVAGVYLVYDLHVPPEEWRSIKAYQTLPQLPKSLHR